MTALDGKDRSIDGLINQSGGLVLEAIGCKFFGRKNGSWREITKIANRGTDIWYVDERGRQGGCLVWTLMRWVDMDRHVALPGEEVEQYDFLRSTVQKLRDRGYSCDDIVAAFERLAAVVEEASDA